MSRESEHEDALLERAIELVQQDESQRDHEAFVRAAEEAGVPRAYLERAAAQLEAERARRRRTVMIAGAATVALGVAGAVVLGQRAEAEAAAAERARLVAEQARARAVYVTFACTRGEDTKDCAPEVRTGITSIIDASDLDRVKAPEDASAHLAVRLEARQLARDENFVYATCRAYAQLTRPGGSAALEYAEPPVKGGHIELEGAMDKACAEAQVGLRAWVKKAFSGEPCETPEDKP